MANDRALDLDNDCDEALGIVTNATSDQMMQNVELSAAAALPG